MHGLPCPLLTNWCLVKSWTKQTARHLLRRGVYHIEQMGEVLAATARDLNGILVTAAIDLAICWRR